MRGLLILLFPAALLGCRRDAPATEVLVLAATTTIEDSGLLDSLVVAFSAAHPSLRVVPVTGGSGTVLAMGRRGDVDVMLTHDPVGEEQFMADGHGDLHREVMHNRFVLAGSRSDPAGIRGMDDVVTAFDRIAEAEAPFISRGDASGTHRKERSLWRLAGRDPDAAEAPWYVEAGLGMGEALLLANERGAYILSGPATFRTLGHVHELDALVTDDPRLLNRYAVTRPVQARNRRAARRFADWITGPGQDVIRRFGRARYDTTLFTPGPPGGR